MKIMKIKDKFMTVFGPFMISFINYFVLKVKLTKPQNLACRSCVLDMIRSTQKL